MFAFALVVCLAGIFCLAPLALYLLWLAVLNKKRRPTVVPGGWDFAALCGGLSGFILFGGGLVLTLLQSNARYLFRRNLEALRAAWAEEQMAWLAVAAGYLFVVVGGGLFTLVLRRRSLVIYNVEPGAVEAAVAEVFDHMGKAVTRTGNLWSGPDPLFELEPFAAGKSVSLRWVSNDDRLFEEVTRHLRPAVADLAPAENPTARWLTTAAVGILVVVVFFVGVMATSLGAWR
ncbi:hypothetical protein [Urbifossiella limnaea]|uniref:Uncharacterized protein n=1 Tax=Urbifossiella limnaea TaxID=2528023 RepID=A0A517XVU9_9BACT|nr:hypothetical protein [Urbifossiella limnaea]QDU21619.1 hypothetical protein ETAA1_35900 [Urbifossiella limnaea]